MSSPTERFSNRVASYVAARPRYPVAVIDFLAARCDLTPQTVVADVGSGTGIFTQLLLAAGCQVFAVEPNAAMRAAAEEALDGVPNFVSVAATAEATTLSDGAVDLVTAGQAFHWFDPQAARREFSRILRPGGWVALIWNDRHAMGTPFLEDYEGLLQTFGTDYASVNHRRISADDLQEFFGGPIQRAVFPNAQALDLADLRDRLASSSYVPAPGSPQHQPMLDALAVMFARHQVGGQVELTYDTTVYIGQLA